MKTAINIKADKEIKERAQKVAKKLGIPLSTIINAYLRQFINTEQVNFSTSYRMSPKLEANIGQAIADWESGKNIRSFANAKEAGEFLKSL